MTQYKLVVDCTTGKQEYIALTPAEIAERDQQAAAAAEEQAKRDADKAARNVLPLSSFYKESKFTRGYRYSCKECEKPRFRNYASKPGIREKRNKTRRAWNRATKYNFPSELYDSRLQEQGNVCAICGTDTPGGKGQFHADHNHETSQPRGVLCHNCNVALGNFQDNPEILKAAIEYLKKYSEAK